MKNVGIYCGSFNPFHVGHLDIAQKAKNIFDRVLILKAYNSDKVINSSKFLFPNVLHNLGFYTDYLDKDSLLTDFIDNIEKCGHIDLGDNCKYAIIRGLRNEKDFEYEENLSAAYRRLKADINIVHIFSNPEYNFVSSSLLREYGHLKAFSNLIVK